MFGMKLLIRLGDFATPATRTWGRLPLLIPFLGFQSSETGTIAQPSDDAGFLTCSRAAPYARRERGTFLALPKLRHSTAPPTDPEVE